MAAIPDPDAPLHIAVELTPRINYGFARCMGSAHRPGGARLIHRLELHNNYQQALKNCRLKVWSQPEFVVARSWQIDRIAPAAIFPLNDADVQLDSGFLWSIPEAFCGTAYFELSAEGIEPVRRSCTVELLAPNEWAGGSQPFELIAAHVLPNDPQVAKILKAASSVLLKNGQRASLEGYQSGSTRRVAEIVAAVWQAVQLLNLSYAEPPASFEEYGQKVRTPSQIAEDGLATCLDTATLFAACLEQAGIHPLLVITPGHAFTGAWLTDETFDDAATFDPSALIKGMELKELLFFETTLAARPEKVPFPQAINARSIPPQVAAVDISRARKFGISPVPLPGTSKRTHDADEVMGKARTSDTDWLEQFADRTPVEVAPPSTPATGRLGEWQKKLLDLSGRNPLLNFKTGRKSIPIECPDAGAIEDLLAAGERFQILPPPQEVIQNDDNEGNVVRIQQYAREIFAEKKLIAWMPPGDLESRLLDLMRTGKRDLQEGGANTLFLALGFLVWNDPKSRSAEASLAPLVLIPVALERRNARSRIILSGLDEEARFNATLLELLKQDFGIHIPELENELPKDDSGLDIQRIYQLVTNAVRNCPGWLVTHETALSTFSFARYLMWKDLREQGEVLKENALVRHLVETPLEPYKPETSFPAARELDSHFPPSKIFMPLPADSSQITAALAAASGKDFVLIGPPGTGKSQSITNMIAHCLAEGKKVLFVSAKKAALDVVYRRLREVGLDDFCLEVHSSKDSNRNAYEQLKRAAARVAGEDTDTEWERETAHLGEQIEKLNQYVVHLHREYPNGFTPYRAMGKLLAAAPVTPVAFSWPTPTAHSREDYDKMRAVAQSLSLTFPQNIAAEPRALLAPVHTTEWSPSGGEQFASTLESSARYLELFTERRRDFLNKLAANLPKTTIHSHAAACTALLKIAQKLIERRGQPGKVLFADDAAALRQQLEAARQTLSTLRNEWNALSCSYREEAAATLDIEEIEKDWREAASLMWPRRTFAQNAVLRVLQTAVENGQRPDPAQDISHLRLWQKARAELNAFDVLSQNTFGLWQGAATDLTALDSVFEAALARGQEIQEWIAQCADSAAQAALQNAIAALLQSETDTPAHDAAQQFVTAFHQLQPQLNLLQSTLHTSIREMVDPTGEDWIAELAKKCRQWHGARGHLRTWALWQKERVAALELGLAPLVEALENEQLAPAQGLAAFEINYQRWWLRAVIDNDAVLRNFSGKQQEFTVNAFAEKMEEYLQLTRRYVRSRIMRHHQTATNRADEEAMGLLTRELKKKMRFRPLRQMIGEASSAILRLTPCMMMSPLSVAQFLALGKRLFDVVIFDEASQIPVWDSIGALARGNQAVIVGDPKQMPPTDFFSRGSEEDEEDINVLQSAESILDECQMARVPTLGLDWHYRSRSESLIAFSNHHYYEDKLVTFPAPQTTDAAVSFHYVAGGVYAAGKARHNENEAKAVVADIVAHLKAPSPDGRKLTVGVVTFNSQQQTLIENLLETERRNDPSIEKWFSDAELEPVMVKNLESVQGDERDIMYFSVTFGPTREGRVSMNFGPLNRDGGERRLNVAITRARCRLKVFSSLRPEQIDLTRTGALGVRDFKHFLEFAERGASALTREANVTGRSFDSDFEAVVAHELTQRGWTVHPQVGVAKFRIDLGVVHPDYPGRYLAGVECDGATYHSAATARDRDKVREGVLRGLGWNILRVWSTDWWENPQCVANLLDKELHELKQRTLPTEPQANEFQTPVQVQSEAEARDAAEMLGDTTSSGGETHTADFFVSLPADYSIPAPLSSFSDEPTISSVPLRGNAPDEEPAEEEQGLTFAPYLPVNFGNLEIKPDATRFYDAEYDHDLRHLIENVVTREGPILEELLIKRITRAHGFSRAGDRIRKRVQALAKGCFHTSQEATRKVYWPSSQVQENWHTFRQPKGDTEPRQIDEIPLAELKVLAALVAQKEADSEDALRRMAKYCGVSRLGENVRTRLQLAWADHLSNKT